MINNDAPEFPNHEKGTRPMGLTQARQGGNSHGRVVVHSPSLLSPQRHFNQTRPVCETLKTSFAALFPPFFHFHQSHKAVSSALQTYSIDISDNFFLDEISIGHFIVSKVLCKVSFVRYSILKRRFTIFRWQVLRLKIHRRSVPQVPSTIV